MKEMNRLKLNEIDPKAIHIANLRFDVAADENESWNVLKKGIEEDGQKEPISVRELTDTEKQACAKGAKYGILDGHQRYEIIKALGKQDDILVNIEKYESSRNDLIFAARMNMSHKDLSILERGKVLHMLLLELGEKQTKKKVGEIGKQVFNIGAAMSYRSMEAWENTPEGIEQLEKEGKAPRAKKAKVTPNFSDEALESSWNSISKRKNLAGYQDYAFQLDAIIDLEKRLKAYKDFLHEEMEACMDDEEDLTEWKKAKKDLDNTRKRLDELVNLLATNAGEVDNEELTQLANKEDYLMGYLMVPPHKEARVVTKMHTVSHSKGSMF